MNRKADIAVLRSLAEQCAEIAARPVQEERRRLWADHFALKKTRPPVLVGYGMHNVWCREVFADHAMRCEDPFLRAHERVLRMRIFHEGIGDDFIQEPWLTQDATRRGSWDRPWGLFQGRRESEREGGAWQFDPPLRDWRDMERLEAVPHEIDEAATARDAGRITEAVGDIMPVDVRRGCFYDGFNADISTHLARLRGLDRLMLDMYEHPGELHRLLAFMRDAILASNRAAEEAGDYSLTTQSNQAMTYARELERPAPDSGPRPRRALWGFCAAQEFTLVSPRFHEEFLFRYQRPVLDHFGLVHYGCCENLTRKIDMLRPLENLRSIAVAPVADLAACAEQVGGDYVLSWRPSPAEMVCCGFDEARVGDTVRRAMEASRGCFIHVLLKDVETLQGDTGRLRRWAAAARLAVEEAA